MPGAAPPVVMTTSFLLFRKVEELADALRSEDYVLPPGNDTPDDSVIVGEATDTMKRLFTLIVTLHMDTEQNPKERELLLEAINFTMIYEVWLHFGFHSARFGFTANWEVFKNSES